MLWWTVSTDDETECFCGFDTQWAEVPACQCIAQKKKWNTVAKIHQQVMQLTERIRKSLGLGRRQKLFAL